MLFVRIAEGNLTTNGIRTRKLYIYEPTSWKPEQYDYASMETLQKFKYGRLYKEKNFILLKWEKWQIIDELKKVYGKDNFVYIFE